MFGKKKQELQKEIGSGAVAGTGVFGEWSDDHSVLWKRNGLKTLEFKVYEKL